MNAEMLPLQVMELVAEHLSLDEADEIQWEKAGKSVAEIESHWNEFSRDMIHLPKSQRERVLQRVEPYTPQTIACDGESFAVHLYNDVQPLKGNPRVTAAVVDCGGERFIAIGM